MRISDWSSDVCSSDLSPRQAARFSRYRVMSGLAAGIARTQWVDHHCKADLVDFHHWQGAFDTMLGAGLSAKGGPMSLLSQGYCAEGCSDWSGRYQPYRFKLELAAALPSLDRKSVV